MKLLLYCIIRDDLSAYRGLPAGVNGKPLQLIAEGGLAAVVSKIARPEAVLSVDSAEQYHEAIARLHQERTVIPFRLGAVFDRVEDIRELLRTRRERFFTMLGALDDCVEMGLRILLHKRSFVGRSAEEALGPLSARTQLDDRSPGTAYLLRQKERYAADLKLQDMTERTVENYSRHFRDLSKRVTYDRAREYHFHGDRSVMVSVYFLVPRDLEGAFRDAYHALDNEMRSRTLLTGPWPPYNFVVANDSGEAVCTSPDRVCESPVVQVLRDLVKPA